MRLAPADDAGVVDGDLLAGLDRSGRRDDVDADAEVRVRDLEVVGVGLDGVVVDRAVSEDDDHAVGPRVHVLPPGSCGGHRPPARPGCGSSGRSR